MTALATASETAAAPEAVEIRPIGPADGERVGRFLQAHLNARVPAATWAAALEVPWRVDEPNRGFMLLAGDEVVGAHLAFYSDRVIDGRVERFCNLGAFCVLPGHRVHSLRLLRRLLAQDGCHFTDFSPSGNVVALNARLGFRTLETATALVPNLPRPSWLRRGAVSSDPAVIERTLTGAALQRYRDHAAAPAARHVVLIEGDRAAWVMFRRDRRKGLPLFASILHASDRELLRRTAGPLARHLLLRHGALVTLLEEHVAGWRPRLSLLASRPRPKMFRSDRLAPEQIDLCYSELACVPW